MMAGYTEVLESLLDYNMLFLRLPNILESCYNWLKSRLLYSRSCKCKDAGIYLPFYAIVGNHVLKQ